MKNSFFSGIKQNIFPTGSSIKLQFLAKYINILSYKFFGILFFKHKI